MILRNVALLLFASGVASATEANLPLQYSFTGTVTSVAGGGGGVTVGQKVPLKISVNVDDNIYGVNSLRTQATHTGGTGNQQYDSIEFQDFNNETRTVTNFFQTFIVDRDYNGTYGYHISAANPQIGPAFSLISVRRGAWCRSLPYRTR